MLLTMRIIVQRESGSSTNVAHNGVVIELHVDAISLATSLFKMGRV